MVENNTLPWLKDNDNADIWDKWFINNRDLLFVNKSGIIEYRINLTENFDESIINTYITSLLE